MRTDESARPRHHILSAVAVCLSGMLVVSCAPKPFAPGDPDPPLNCRTRVHPDDALLVGGREKDGVVHFRVAFDPDAEPLQKKALTAGMEMWNRHSKETGFAFEEGTTVAVDFRLQRGARGLPNPREIEQTSCTGYGSPGSVIWYSPQGMDWVTRKADVTAAARIYAHELGHALNVCDKPATTSIMREGDPNVLCRDRAWTSPLDIPAEDLRDARICGHGARAKARTR